MTEPSATALPGTVPAPPARLEPDAIGVAQDTIIGMATSAPAAVVGLTLAGLAAAAAYGGGVLMLISANAYRRLNILMLLSRLLLKSDFYHIRRETDPGVTAS